MASSQVVRWIRGMMFRRANPKIGGTEIADARRLADAECALGVEPEGCARLDERTVDDLDLPLVFSSIDRTVTPTGAQVLWRWLAAPAAQLTILTAREAKLGLLADPALRDRITSTLAGPAAADAPHLPRLLWEPPPRPLRAMPLIALVATLLACVALARWWPPFVLGALVVFVIDVLVDDWSNLRLAHQARALEVLGQTLDSVARLVWRDELPAELAAGIAADLGPRAVLRTRLALLTARDPIGLFELIRAGFLVRLFALRSCMRIVETERERLRRVVLWLGELDALTAIARLRAEHRGLRVPELVAGPPQIAAREIRHPAIAGAIGNDLALDARGLLVTGSNMSGKSTFLRTIAINAILAQAIHTTFGAWRASLFRVRSVMRVADDTSHGMSTYAVEVASIGELVSSVSARDILPALFVIDEPFNGTNPAIRVPIVVAVLEYLAARDLVVAATHDLDVATRLCDRFDRGYFAEVDAGTFDRRLRPGVAPSTNAIALLERAGYPEAILEHISRASPQA